MIVGAVQVYFRDLKSFMPYVLRVWLFVSPVLYFADEMPQKYRWLLDVNPLGQLLENWSLVHQPGRSRRTWPAWRSARRGRSAS